MTILYFVKELGDNACSNTIMKKHMEIFGEECGIGAVYAYTDEFADMGLTTYKWSDPLPELNNRRKKFFYITQNGRIALQRWQDKHGQIVPSEKLFQPPPTP